MQLEHAWWDSLSLFSLSHPLPLFSDFSPLIPVRRAWWDMPRQLPLSLYPTVFVWVLEAMLLHALQALISH